MRYSKLEIINIIENCLNIAEIYHCCQILATLYKSGEDYDKNFINNVACQKINTIENPNKFNL